MPFFICSWSHLLFFPTPTLTSTPAIQKPASRPTDTKINKVITFQVLLFSSRSFHPSLANLLYASCVVSLCIVEQYASDLFKYVIRHTHEPFIVAYSRPSLFILSFQPLLLVLRFTLCLNVNFTNVENHADTNTLLNFH